MIYRVIIMLITLGVGSVYAQTSEIRILETKRENIQRLVCAYEDSLADLDFIISELKAGRFVDYSETVFYNRLQTKKESENTIQKPANNNSNKLGNPGNVSSTLKSKSQRSTSQKAATKSKKYIKNSSSGNSKTEVQAKKYRRRVGAICIDGTRSYATGRGAYSHHGGVEDIGL